MSGCVTFCQERSIRRPTEYLKRWGVFIDGTYWGFYCAAPNNEYFLHRGLYSLQSRLYTPGLSFERAAQEACKEDGIPFSWYEVTKEP